MKDNVLGERLRQLRQECSKSIYDVGKELYRSASCIGMYERGDSIPNAKTLMEFAHYYNVSTDYLLGLTDLCTADDDMRCACTMTGVSDEIIASLHYLSNISWAKEMVCNTILSIMSGVAMQQCEEYLHKETKENAE